MVLWYYEKEHQEESPKIEDEPIQEEPLKIEDEQKQIKDFINKLKNINDSNLQDLIEEIKKLITTLLLNVQKQNIEVVGMHKNNKEYIDKWTTNIDNDNITSEEAYKLATILSYEQTKRHDGRPLSMFRFRKDITNSKYHHLVLNAINMYSSHCRSSVDYIKKKNLTGLIKSVEYVLDTNNEVISEIQTYIIIDNNIIGYNLLSYYTTILCILLSILSLISHPNFGIHIKAVDPSTRNDKNTSNAANSALGTTSSLAGLFGFGGKSRRRATKRHKKYHQKTRKAKSNNRGVRKTSHRRKK